MNAVSRLAERLSLPRAAVGLFTLALVARAIVGLAFPHPAYPDSSYYVNVASALAEGRGLVLDHIWNFVDVGGRLPAEPQLPIPSNGHWMPLASLVQLPFMLALGPSGLAGALPFWLIGALAAPLAWLAGREAGLGERVALVGAVLTAIPARVLGFLGQPDNFGLYMTLGALALLLAARALNGDRRALVAGGLVVGLATLARNDGVLLGVPFALIGLGQAWRARHVRTELLRAVGGAAGCALVFALVVGPWLVRQLAVFGTLSPSAASGRILWIADYSQLWRIADQPSLAALLADPAALVASRLAGFGDAVSIFVSGPLLGSLAFLGAWALWRLRANRALWPFALYALLLFAAAGLLFAPHVRHGMFLHSAVALLPHSYLLAAAGLERLASWFAGRRGWPVARAWRPLVALAIFGALLTGAHQTLLNRSVWQSEQRLRAQLAGAIDAPGDERLMSADPGAYRYLAGRGGVVTPRESLAEIERVARAYGVRWLIIERDHIVPALVPVLTGSVDPAWLSGPIARVDDPRDAAGEPLGALYAVCLEPADPRCD